MIRGDQCLSSNIYCLHVQNHPSCGLMGGGGEGVLFTLSKINETPLE